MPQWFSQNADVVKTIQRCGHCGEECPKSQNFCADCRLVAGRRTVCKDNEKIFSDAGLCWKCRACRIE